jgi:TetR/AcrR family transcriptional regulator, cholesterol catabolism regulator
MAERRDELLQVAKETFAERGVKAATVREIGARAGVVSGSLYHYFDSKLDMVDAILAEFCDEILHSYDAIDTSTDDVTRLRAFAQYAFSLIPSDRSALTIFFNEGQYLSSQPRFAYLVAFDRRIERYWVDVIKAGVKQGTIRPDVDARLFYRVVRDTIAGAVRWYVPSKSRPIDDVADAVIELLLRGALVDGTGGDRQTSGPSG